MAGQPCMQLPVGIGLLRHGEQMIPPVKALGSEYVGVRYRAARAPGDEATVAPRRRGQRHHAHLVRAVGGPPRSTRGSRVEFMTAGPSS